MEIKEFFKEMYKGSGDMEILLYSVNEKKGWSNPKRVLIRELLSSEKYFDEKKFDYYTIDTKMTITTKVESKYMKTDYMLVLPKRFKHSILVIEYKIKAMSKINFPIV